MSVADQARNELVELVELVSARCGRSAVELRRSAAFFRGRGELPWLPWELQCSPADVAAQLEGCARELDPQGGTR